MKVPFLFLFFIAACSLKSFASPADTVRTYFDKQWKETIAENAGYFRKAWKEQNLWQVRDYFISGQLQMSGAFSDDSLNIHEGSFVYYYGNGKLSKTAFYIHGKAEGTIKNWYELGNLSDTFYYKNGEAQGAGRRWFENGHLAESTNYKDGMLHGPQVWYFKNGQRSEEGIYERDSAITVKLWTEDGTPDPEGIPNIVMPAFSTADGKALAGFLGSELRYPENQRRKGQEGRTKVQFVVAEDGSIRETTVVESSGVKELDAEALRVIRAMPKWRPGRNHNRPVKIWFTLPVTFKLD